MFAPLATSILCTTVGLLVFFLCGYRNTHQKITGVESDADLVLRDELEQLPTSQLLRRAETMGVDEEQLSAALEETTYGAMSRKNLVQLLFDKECSAPRKHILELGSLTLSNLRERVSAPTSVATL